jgi:protein-S-isoprenylcysteine O-methyltransferase Ste14
VKIRLEDLTPAFFVFSSFALLLIALAVRAYVLSSKKSSEQVRRRAYWIAAMVSGLVALFGTVVYAIPVLGDFNIPEVRFQDALIGALIVWGICGCAWVVAVRCVISALRSNGKQQ